MEKQLLENEFEAFFYNSPVIKIILDTERKIHYINLIGQKYAGRSEAILAGVRAGEALRCIHSADDPRGCGFGEECQRCDMRRIINETFEQSLSHYREQVTLSLGSQQDSQQMTFYVSSIPLQVKGQELILLTVEDITEQMAVADALRRSEERYALAQRAANIGSWDWNIETGALFWSERIEPVFGFGKGEFGGTYEAFLASVHPDDRDLVVDSVNKAVNEGAEYAIEHRIIWPDGSVHWVSENGDVFRDENGKPIRMIGIVQDITGRKVMEDELRRRDAVNSLAQYAIKLGTWEWDMPDGEFHWSEQAAAIFGLEPNELGRLYDNALGMVFPADRKQVEDALQKAAREQTDYHEIFRVLWSDGSVHWVESVGRIVPSVGGKSNRMVGAIQDITEHKSKEDSLKRDLALTQALARLSNMLISPRASLKQITDLIVKYAQIVTGSEHAFVQARDPVTGNMIGHAATAMSANGCTAEEQDEGIVFPFGADGQYPSLWGYALNQHKGFFTNETVNHPSARGVPAGHIAIRNYLAVPALMGSELMGQIAVANSSHPYTEDDLSAVTRLAELMALAAYRDRYETMLHKRTLELEEATQELKRSNADLEQFAYAASHDLQEPLRMIANYLQLLERRYGDNLEGDARTFVEFAVDGAKRMQDLINDLLEFSRIGSRGRPFQPTDMNEVVAEAMQFIKLAIEQNNGSITVDELPTIMADRPQMVQLIQNLLSNALKFRGKNLPVIYLTHNIENGMTIFSVKDNGIGIASEHWERIFGIFQRLHTRAQYPGTGIGLAICERIVSRHGGKIWVESEEGKGSTFFFSIPSQLKVENG